MPTLDRESRQLLNKARNLGGKGPTIYLEDHELLRLCAIVAIDLDRQNIVSNFVAEEEASAEYYGIPLEWFHQPVDEEISLVDTYLLLKDNIPDFGTYFSKLCELHKRRVKFKRILETQTFTPLDPIVPRCLLEYGMMPFDPTFRRRVDGKKDFQ
jgi:hypothetical protein